MIQNNYFTDNSDLLEQFEEIIDWKEVVENYEYGFRDAKTYKETKDENLAMAPDSVEAAVEYYRALLESAGELIGKELAPVSQKMDEIGLKFDNGKVTFPEPMIKAYNILKEAGLQPYGLSRHYGGLGLPGTVQALFMDMIGRGDASMAIAFGCTNIGEVLERFASPELAKKYVSKLASGEYTCAMSLTEPNYGSDLSNVQTKAVKDADGNWKLTGTKRFITHACGFDSTPSIILTLARTGAPGGGARGLSFFIVESKDVEIANIETKMGLHCSPTCEVVYDNTPGILIGNEGEGLVKGAMGMMNTARLSIAAQSMGIGAAAYMEAAKYASEREQFGRTIDQIPAVRKILDRMDREVAAMRCMLLEAARTVDMYLWRKEWLGHDGMDEKAVRKDEQVRYWDKLASLFTPLTKYYVTEWCNTLAYDAVQIHGGSGYCEEYDVARIYRDARITTIYEGTTQLQVVGSIGGVVVGMAAKGQLREYLNTEMAKFSPSAELKELFAKFEEIVEMFKSIDDSVTRDKLAFEVVESSARVINGVLMERATSRVSKPESKERRARLAREYNTDSEAILTSNFVRIKNGARQPAAV